MARPPQEALDWLKSREGYREDVYLDSEDTPTVGYGHRTELPVGTRITEPEADMMLGADGQEAWDAAIEQAEELGQPDLAEPLFHVNFQLGPNWNQIHTETWRKMKEDTLENAALEAEDSKWFRQTPKRVRDLQYALRGQPRQEEY